MKEDYFVRPLLRVRDVAASVAYYCEKLGFEKRWEHGQEKPIIAEVGRNEISIILDSGSVLPKAATPSVLSVSLHEPQKLGALHREFKERGANIVRAPFPVVWSKDGYQFDVEDPDGNLLLFWGDQPA